MIYLKSPQNFKNLLQTHCTIRKFRNVQYILLLNQLIKIYTRKQACFLLRISPLPLNRFVWICLSLGQKIAPNESPHSGIFVCSMSILATQSITNDCDPLRTCAHVNWSNTLAERLCVSTFIILPFHLCNIPKN